MSVLETSSKISEDTRILLPNGNEESYLKFSSEPYKIDFVLVYRKSIIEKRKLAQEKLDVFHQNLKSQGLKLEIDSEDDRDSVYVKIHAPFEVLGRYAEILKLRMPITNIDGETSLCNYKQAGIWTSGLKVLRSMKLERYIRADAEDLPAFQPRITWPFAQTKEYLFDVPVNLDDFFTYTERSHIVNYILRHCKYAEGKFSFGIGKLLDERVYLAAYPMHDKVAKGKVTAKIPNQRTALIKHWASFRQWYKLQPLDHIKDYFGAELAMYFAWMGHYIFCLIFLSIICIIFVIYGIGISFSDEVSQEVCINGSSYIMCPLCYKECPLWRLSDSCAYSRISRIFNNQSTIFFTIIISIWGLVFNIYWQRAQAEYVHRWSLPDISSGLEPPRPEFNQYMQSIEGKVGKNGKKKVSKVSLRGRLPTLLLTFSTVLLLICLAIGFVLGVIVYRVSVFTALKAQNLLFARNFASVISVATAASINLCVIVFLTLIYQRIATWLTEKELLRTDSEYHDSLALKLYLLEFVNNYASVFYIALFKGKFAELPGDKPKPISLLIEKCDVGGCMVEVTIQMAVIFIGKQILMNLKDPTIILLIRIFQRIKDGKIDCKKSFANDFHLCEYEEIQLFFEYIEMMIQYGFMCFFIAAFPIAPLFALGNNIIEIRRDSSKLIRNYRRPVAKPVNGIGIWSTILFTITRLAPLSNALIIAFTSDFIPSLVFTYKYSSDGSLSGYTNFSLSFYNTADIKNFTAVSSFDGVTPSVCRYRQYRNPPWGKDPYDLSPVYYEILAAQLLFVVTFENTLLAMLEFIRWIYPARPRSLKEHVNAETIRIAEFILRSEVVLAKCQPILMRLKTPRVKREQKKAAEEKRKVSKETFL